MAKLVELGSRRFNQEFAAGFNKRLQGANPERIARLVYLVQLYGYHLNAKTRRFLYDMAIAELGSWVNRNGGAWGSSPKTYPPRGTGRRRRP